MDASFYYSIRNPINDDNVLEEFVRIYHNLGNSNYYDALLKRSDSTLPSNSFSSSDRDVLYVGMFYHWRNSIINYYNNLDSNDLFRKKMTSTLIKHIADKTPRTYSDVMEIMKPKNSNSELDKALLVFSFCNFDKNYWNFVESKKLDVSINGINNDSVKHRLYVNCDLSIIHKLVYKFIKKCNENNLPYYFKYSNFDRDDTFVIYSDDENLDKYINILNTIIYEDRLHNSINRPPLTTGLINNYIGYGANPDSDKTTYNDKRSKVISNSIYTTTINTIRECLRFEVKDSSGEILSYNNYLIKKLVLHIKDRLKDNIDIEYSTFSNSVKASLDNDINKIFNNYSISVPYKNTFVDITYGDVYWLIRNQSMFLYKNVDSYKDRLRNEIRRESISSDIDPDNFVFDNNSFFDKIDLSDKKNSK